MCTQSEEKVRAHGLKNCSTPFLYIVQRIALDLFRSMVAFRKKASAPKTRLAGMMEGVSRVP